MARPIVDASLAKLDRKYEEALTAHQKGDFEGSVRTLRAIIKEIDGLPESADSFAQWTRALMFLARVESTLGHKSEGRAALEQLVKAAPTVKADLALYPPSFQKQIEEVRDQLPTLPTRTLTVNAKSATKGGVVRVNDREVGEAPLTVSLPAATYWVSVSQGALRMPAILVDLSEENRTVDLDLAAPMRPNAGPGYAFSEATRGQALIAAGSQLGVDKLLALSLAAEGTTRLLVGKLYDVRRSMLEQEGYIRLAGRSAAPGHLDALAHFFASGGSGSGVYAGAPLRMAADGSVPGASNRFGIQGTWVWDSDQKSGGGTEGTNVTGGYPPYDPKRGAMCLAGRSPAPKEDHGATWGASIGLRMSPSQSTYRESTPAISPRCFRITISGHWRPGRLRAHLLPTVTSPRTYPPGKDLVVGVNEVCVTNLEKPSWCRSATNVTCLDATSLDQWIPAIYTSMEANWDLGTTFDFCITSIVPHD